MPNTASVYVDVQAAQAGDKQAFTRLVEVTCSLVSSIAFAILRDPDLSRDVAQDVYLMAWRDIGRLRKPASFLPWLRQITRHRAHHVLRSRRRWRRRIDDDAADGLLDVVVDPSPDASQQLVDEETRQAVAATFELLPDDTREVVTLYYREGRSTAQVAALLGLSEAAVRQRLSRARERLREDLLDRLGHGLAAMAPGPVLVASIAAALSIGAPTASVAATLSSAGLKGAGPVAGATMVFANGALFLASAVPGMVGGIWGVMFGTSRLVRVARDNEERRALRRLQWAGIVTVIVFTLGAPASFVLTRSRAVFVASFLAFFAALFAMNQVWLPRIVSRRFEAEMREDAVSATTRRRRERILERIGWIVGLILGTAGLLAAMFFVQE